MLPSLLWPASRQFGLTGQFVIPLKLMSISAEKVSATVVVGCCRRFSRQYKTEWSRFCRRVHENCRRISSIEQLVSSCSGARKCEDDVH